MHVRLKQRGPGATERALTDVLRLVGDGHPDWIAFLRANDGCTVDPSVFAIGDHNRDTIEQLWSADEVARQRRELQPHLRKHLLAIAPTACGNLVCLDRADGHSVYFFDHEVEEATLIADSFSAFLDELRPFDPSSVKLEPGQVISKWVDPDFLAQLEQDGDDD